MYNSKGWLESWLENNYSSVKEGLIEIGFIKDYQNMVGLELILDFSDFKNEYGTNNSHCELYHVKYAGHVNDSQDKKIVLKCSLDKDWTDILIDIKAKGANVPKFYSIDRNTTLYEWIENALPLRDAFSEKKINIWTLESIGEQLAFLGSNKISYSLFNLLLDDLYNAWVKDINGIHSDWKLFSTFEGTIIDQERKIRQMSYLQPDQKMEIIRSYMDNMSKLLPDTSTNISTSSNIF